MGVLATCRVAGLRGPGDEDVQRGAVRVILTTNFDRLIEQALQAEGIFPQVIASPTAIEGMEPLAHARCTIIKLHGDYARIDQLNTVEELSSYADATQTLLERVLDEYGLIVNGWSADWDHALVSAIEATRSRRYPLYWSSYGTLGSAAKRLVAQHRAQVVAGATADEFFHDVVMRLEALDRLAQPPLSRDMAVTRLKRTLPEPTRHIDVHDLFEAELTRIRQNIADRTQLAPSMDGDVLQAEHDRLRAQCDTLLHLIANGVYFDRDRQHTALWVWVIETLMRMQRRPDGSFHDFWMNLDSYPGLLALKAANLAAVAARHDDVLMRILKEPARTDAYERGRQATALKVLDEFSILDSRVVNGFPKWNATKWLFPLSHHLRGELKPVLLPFVGDEASYAELFSRAEYRTSLARTLNSLRALPGEYILESQWDPDTGFYWESDFRRNADREAWGWEEVPEGETDIFSETLSKLTDELRTYRRWG